MRASEVEHAYTQPTHYASRWVRRQSWSQSCMGCGGFILHGRSCTRHARLVTRCCTWHGAPMTPRWRSSPTMPWGVRGCGWARCQARQHLEDAIACYTPDQRRAPEFRIGHDLGVACRFYAAQILWLLGYPAQALVRLHDALTLAHTLSHPLSLAWMRCRAAIFFQCCRNVPAVREQQRLPSRLRLRRGFHGGRPGERSCVGGRWPCRARGSRLVQVHQGSRPCRPPGQHGPYLRTVLADISAHLGHTNDSLQALTEAHPGRAA